MPIPEEVLRRLHQSLDRAAKSGLPEPGAMSLATSDGAGRPLARMVLLRGLDARGFVFYTNLGSRKSRQLQENPKAALCFYWPPLEEQVLVEGDVVPVDDAEADAYWRTRPRKSRLGGWASRQSEPMASRVTLLRRIVGMTARFGVGDVPRPPFWSGYRVIPTRIEFWRAGAFRLHERLSYEREGESWTRRLLYP